MAIHPQSRRRLRFAGVIATAAAASLLLVGCSSAAAPQPTGDPDDGTTLTMWARPDNGPTAQLLVDEYNKTHKNVVKLTRVPSVSFQAKVGAAAGSGGLPDILASDVVLAPNYVKQGLYQDLTAPVTSLPYYSSLSHAHTDATTLDGKIYGTPLVVDSSLIIYNKDLFTAAGLDPSVGPTNFNDIYNDARAIRDKVGGDTYGFYFGGNCAGCNAYTMFPYLVAAGTPPFTNDGNTGDFDSPAMKSTLDLYKKMYDEGIMPASAKEEDGSNWTTQFNSGKIGILPVGTFDFSSLASAPFQWGVAELPAPDGSKTSTFVGGDVAGISKDSKHSAEALNFLEWTLDQDAQVNVLAKNGNLPSRVDLATNEFSAKDPRVVQAIQGLANGYTPSSVAYGAVISSATGPWETMFRDYIFNDKPDAIEVGQKAMQAGIDQAN